MLKLDHEGTGLASGTLTVMTRSSDSSAKPVPVTVRYTYELQNPLNEKVFWPVLVAIILIGILLPVALLYLVKWWSAKIPGATLSIGSVRGPVGPTGSFLESVSLIPQDLHVVPLEGTDRRSVALTGGATVRTKTGWGLTEPGYAVVQGQPGVTAGGSSRLPLAIQDHWIALLDSADPHRGDVELVVLLAPSSTKLPDLLADARSRVPELVEKLRQSLGDAPPPTPGGPGDGGADGEWGSTTTVPTPPSPGSSPDTW